MNRELCVLIYSQYSSASEQLIDYISKLPYDLAAITGIVLLQADNKMIRDELYKIDIHTVPCIYVKYFDGTHQIYKDNQVYDFINAVTQAINGNNNKTYNNDNDGSGSGGDDDDDNNTTIVDTIVKHENVMSTAIALQKQRESTEIVKKPEGIIQNPIITVPKAAIKKNVTRFDDSLLK